MTHLATRKSVEEAVDQYFSGKISVDEAFRRAYGPDPRTTQPQTTTAAGGEPTSHPKRGKGKR